MENKSIGVIIALFVSTIFIGSVLYPIISDVAADSDSFENTGYFYVDKVTESTTISWDSTNPFDLIINGATFDINTLPTSRAISIIASDSGVIRAINAGNSVILQGYFSTYFGINSSFTATITESTAVMVVDGTERTHTATEFYAISATPSNYVMKDANNPVYLTETSEYILAGMTTVGATDIGVYAKGTLAGFDPSFFSGVVTDSEISNLTFVTNAIESHIGLKSLDKITFDMSITVNDNTYSGDVTYSYFIVPASVSADRVDPMDSTIAGLLFAIVPIVLVSLLTVAFIAIKGRY